MRLPQDYDNAVSLAPHQKEARVVETLLPFLVPQLQTWRHQPDTCRPRSRVSFGTTRHPVSKHPGPVRITGALVCVRRVENRRRPLTERSEAERCHAEDQESTLHSFTMARRFTPCNAESVITLAPDRGRVLRPDRSTRPSATRPAGAKCARPETTRHGGPLDARFPDPVSKPRHARTRVDPPATELSPHLGRMLARILENVGECMATLRRAAQNRCVVAVAPHRAVALHVAVDRPGQPDRETLHPRG